MKQRNPWGMALLLLLLWAVGGFAQVERIWLTHRSNEPSQLVVNWTTKRPGDSTVRYGGTKAYGQEVQVPGSRTLHHVAIPLPKSGTGLHYAVYSGDQTSGDMTFRGYPTEQLRVAVVANWQSKPNLKALMKDDPHLLLTAGDHVADLWHDCGEGVKDCVKPFAALIDRYPELFRSVPFLPVLGNHDREIRPRGKRPPKEAVYDIDATAYRSFFPLPDDGWKWRFEVPEFRLCLLALDLNHISDRGTTWQTCHDFGKDSAQFQWYQKRMEERRSGFVVTLYNERNAGMRAQEKGAWHRMFSQGTLAISGFGYYAERAEVDGFSYYNTSLGGKGDRYPDPASQVLHSEDNYLLMTFDKASGRLIVEQKSLAGAVLDRQTIRIEDRGKRAVISPATKDREGMLVHEVQSPYQAGKTQIRVLLPDKLEPGKRYPVVYVLPVEAGRESRFGDGMVEVKQRGLHNRHDAIFVAPTFSHLPWYADHPTHLEIRQETYLLKAVLPFVERSYPTERGADGRRLLGFSKSGWGGYGLLLRHPGIFGKAAAWDAPLMMDRPGRYGSGEIFGTAEHFEGYRISKLLESRAGQLRTERRLILTGVGNFRDDHRRAHALMEKLGVAHAYRDGPARKHDWHSGWVEEAVELLLRTGKEGRTP